MMRSFSISCLFLLLMSTAAWGQEEFRPIAGPCDFTFPRDHGAHEGHRVEWWYYTGNVENSLRERYGFQLTFFRTELIPPGRDKDWPPSPSAWRARELFSAHAALSDPGERRFLYDQKVVRGAAGLAGVEVADESTKIFLDDWSSQLRQESHTLKASADLFGLDLFCKPAKPPVAHGLKGYSRKGKRPESASCYYSFTRLDTTGAITVRGVRQDVRGTAWMDHEFSSAPLEEDLTGWDWFSLQLDDRTELMIYLLRLDAGGYSPASSGTFVKDSGEAVHLSHEDFLVEILDRWKSPRSGGLYPSKWRVRVFPVKMELSIEPNLADQELVAGTAAQPTYWEGSVSVSGRNGNRPVKGVGYVEMTGYARPFNLTPSR